MIKTKDGYTIYEGMYLSDSDGVYIVKSINSYDVTLREIVWDDDKHPEDYHLGDYRYLTPKEVGCLEFID